MVVAVNRADDAFPKPHDVKGLKSFHWMEMADDGKTARVWRCASLFQRVCWNIPLPKRRFSLGVDHSSTVVLAVSGLAQCNHDTVFQLTVLQLQSRSHPNCCSHTDRVITGSGASAQGRPARLVPLRRAAFVLCPPTSEPCLTSARAHLAGPHRIRRVRWSFLAFEYSCSISDPRLIDSPSFPIFVPARSQAN